MNLEMGYNKPLPNDLEIFLKICVRFLNLKKGSYFNLPKRFSSFVVAWDLILSVTKTLYKISTSLLFSGIDKTIDASTSEKVNFNIPYKNTTAENRSLVSKQIKAEKSFKLSSYSGNKLSVSFRKCNKNSESKNDFFELFQKAGKVLICVLFQFNSFKDSFLIRFQSANKRTLQPSKLVSILGFRSRHSHHPFSDLSGMNTKIF